MYSEIVAAGFEKHNHLETLSTIGYLKSAG